MTSADYTTQSDVISYLGAAGFNLQVDGALISELITVHSRMIDQETGRPPGYWMSQTSITRSYSVDPGSDRDDLLTSDTDMGLEWLTIDPFQSITLVTMCSEIDRSDQVTVSLTDGTQPYFAVPYPLNGPPFTRLFMPNGFWQDRYMIGNVRVTGSTLLPAEITHACNLWVAHTWKARNANYTDVVVRPDGPTLVFDRRPPRDVIAILGYFQNEEQTVLFY